MNLFVVVNEEQFYFGRIGSVFSETREHIWLDLSDDRVQFEKSEVRQII